jgi:transposase-like protein
MNIDGHAASHRALRLLRQENPEWRSVVVRSRRYLNNIVEQDDLRGYERGNPCPRLSLEAGYSAPSGRYSCLLF